MSKLTRRELLALAGASALVGPLIGRARAAAVNANPFTGRRLYVDPASQAAQWVRANERARPDDAALVRKIAEQPTAMWTGRWKDDPGAGIRGVLDRAAGGFCVFVAYNIPKRDLGQYSAGGAPDAEAYLKWFAAMLSGFRKDPAALVFEPDALAHLDQLPRDDQSTRMKTFQRAMALAADV